MKKKNNKIIVSPELSVNDMEELLMSDEITDKKKILVRQWLVSKRDKISEELSTCDADKGIFGEEGAVCRFMTPYNDWYRLACEKLLRDKNPYIYVQGSGVHKRINLLLPDMTPSQRNELKDLLFDTIKDLKDMYDKGYGRHGLSLQEVMEGLYQGSEDDRIRRRNKKVDIELEKEEEDEFIR